MSLKAYCCREECFQIVVNKTGEVPVYFIFSISHRPNVIYCIGWNNNDPNPPGYILYIVYPKKYAHGFCFAVLCCGYTLTDFAISIRLTSLALWQSNDCPSASKATLMNMDKYFMWIHYGRLYNHNKAKQNKTVCIFLGIYCSQRQCKCLEILGKRHWIKRSFLPVWFPIMQCRS